MEEVRPSGQLRKIKFSIRLKLLLVFSGLVLISLSSYCLYALKSFKKDKVAYIFGAVNSSTNLLTEQTEQYFTSSLRLAYLAGGLFAKSADNEPLIEDIITKDPYTVSFEIFNRKERSIEKVFSVFDKSYLTQNQLDSTFWNIPSIGLSEFEKLVEKKFILERVSSSKQILFKILAYNPNEKKVYRLHLSGDNLQNTFSSNKEVASFLFDSRGEYFLSGGSADEKRKLPSYLSEILNSPSNAGTKERQLNAQETVLSSFQKIPQFQLFILNEISKEEAFKALDKLIKESIVFAILLVMMALIFAMVLSKSFTRPIKALVAGTQKVAEGNFEDEIKVEAQDEIGVLSDSFNFMSQEILRYMGEVKEKARMENELAVAQLVQASFFPADDQEFGPVKLSGYYEPASECGGDWWGSRLIGNKLLIFVGDATGHGVPAALVTATANCTVNLLEHMAQKDPSIVDSPGRILSIMNDVVHKVGGKILMTFFVASLDLDTYECKFANASHNPPFWYKKSDGEPNKSDIDVLLVSSGTRLGHKSQADYAEESVRLKPGDSLLFCTDGIIEGMDPEGKLYGERRFMRSYLSYVNADTRTVVDGMLKDAREFFQGVPVDDDITLVAVKILES